MLLWILERRNGLACGIYDGSAAGCRFASKQILCVVQLCLNALFSASGYSAYQLIFGSNAAKPSRWDDDDEDLLFVWDNTSSAQFAQR